MADELTLHLVRHGETASYRHDTGLTARGEDRATDYGRRLARALGPASLRIGCSPTVRTHATAELLRRAYVARAGAGTASPPAAEPAFANLRITVGDALLEPTQARPLLPAAAADQGWAVEAQRFWDVHDAGGDTVAFWMTAPLVWHEPPGTTVRRMLVRAAELGRAGEGTARHHVVVTHEACLRALLAWCCGADPGKLANTEEVHLALAAGRPTVRVRYRQQGWEMPIPVARAPAG